MADISKCSGDNCPLKETCYRFTAIADEIWQTYGVFEYDDGCSYYWKTERLPKK